MIGEIDVIKRLEFAIPYGLEELQTFCLQMLAPTRPPLYPNSSTTHSQPQFRP